MDHDWYICKYFQVLDRPASDPEWFKARNQMGQVAIRALSSLNSPLLAVAKTNNWNAGGFGAVELPAGALPVPHPGRARWKERLGCTGGGNFFAKLTHFILRRQMVEQQMATERLARKFRASLGTTVRSGRGWMEPHSVFDLFSFGW